MRLTYVLDVFFSHILSVSYTQTTDLNDYLNYAGPRINYSPEQLHSNEIWIPPATLLFSKGIHQCNPQVEQWGGLPAAFFHHSTESDLPFDLFSFCFFLVSRYEEYIAPEEAFDRHGRFKAESSLAFRQKFLKKAVVNQWALRIKKLIEKRWPGTEFPISTFQCIPSFDIDLAWAYRERPLWRMLGGSLRDLIKAKTHWLRHRWQVLLNDSTDPFDTYEYIGSLHALYGFSPIFFFLLADPGRYDRSISPSNPRLKELIRKIAQQNRVGIHPSYRSHQKKPLLKKEIDRLAGVSNQPVIRSRFHFLKFNIPGSYRRLISSGIQHDYTMGYATQPGFRASIATPYPWYDLEKEAATSLLIHPFQVMDGTLKNYLKVSPEEGLQLVKNLVEHTASVKGTFVILWHNSSFSYIAGWEKWKNVYEEILKYCHKHTK